jgi:hypothetical protein
MTVYKVTVWWDRPFGKKPSSTGTPQDYGVAVAPDGTITALKMLKPELMRIVSKRKDPRTQGHIHHFSRRSWAFPKYFELAEGETQAFLLAQMFERCAKWHEGAAMSLFRIRVMRKDGLVATFGINVLKAPYFFADRDLMVDDKGFKKRIFHIVRPHSRHVNGGDRTAFVKEHFRGERRFKWAGYDVLITVPGVHHWDVAEFNVGAVDERFAEEKGLSGEKLGQFIATAIEGNHKR